MHNKVEREAGEMEGSAYGVETAFQAGMLSSLRLQHASNLSWLINIIYWAVPFALLQSSTIAISSHEVQL